MIKPTLLTDWSGRRVVNWLVSEKLDGWRALWDGQHLYSRQGNRYDAPDWFKAGMPASPLDGELYLGRGTRGILSGKVQSGDWSGVQFHVFDSMADGPFAERWAMLRGLALPEHCKLVWHIQIKVQSDLFVFTNRVIEAGGEGSVVRNPTALYQEGRTTLVQRLKAVVQ